MLCYRTGHGRHNVRTPAIRTLREKKKTKDKRNKWKTKRKRKKKKRKSLTQQQTHTPKKIFIKEKPNSTRKIPGA